MAMRTWFEVANHIPLLALRASVMLAWHGGAA